jgi:hypothetical protein
MGLTRWQRTRGKACSVEGCPWLSDTDGMCTRHYLKSRPPSSRVETKRVPTKIRRYLERWKAEPSFEVCWYIYGLADPRTGEVFYCGRTKNIGPRMHCHSSPYYWLKNANSKYGATMRALKAAGVRPVLVVFEKTSDAQREDFHIRRLRSIGHELCNRYQGVSR